MSLNDLAKRINECSTAHGFWPEEGRNFGEMIALAHSELSEALEEHRSGKPLMYYKCKVCGRESHTPMVTHRVRHNNPVLEIISRYVRVIQIPPCTGELKPEGTAIELIDSIVRELDTLASLRVDIDALMDLKVTYNESRPYKHGRNY